MGFRDFIVNQWYRSRLFSNFERYQQIKPPANPSRHYIDRLVNRLLDHRSAWFARKELEMMGATAADSLTAASTDHRFLLARWDSVMIPAPLESLLRLLTPHNSSRVFQLAMELADSPSDDVRKLAALYLARFGRNDSVPKLVQLLNKSDGSIRCAVATGLCDAAEQGCEDDFRKKMYDIMLAQCELNWGDVTNNASAAVAALNPERAAIDFSSARWLSTACSHSLQILKACIAAGVVLDATHVDNLLRQSLRLAVGENGYTHECVAAEAIKMLAAGQGERLRPLLTELLQSNQPKIQEAAAEELGRLAGVTDPYGFVLDRMEQVGYDSLSEQQQMIYLLTKFDGEVCNGGLMQFFGNSSGDRVDETLQMLKQFPMNEGYRLLEKAIQCVGPAAKERNRERRLALLGKRYDKLQAAFEPLEQEYSDSKEALKPLRQRLLLFAIEHANEFQP